MPDFNFNGLTQTNPQPITNAAASPTQGNAPAGFNFAGVQQVDSDAANEAKYGTAPEMAKTAVEGVARGATLGVSDLAENELFDNAKERQARMQANPWTSNLSQMAGGAGLIAATGGAGAIAEGGGTLARVAAMGLEGGAFGAGNAVTDYSLGDPNLNAQKVLTDIGMGAALGGGLGILSRGVEAALPAATQKLSNALSSIKDYSATIGENAPEGSWMSKLNDGITGANGSPESIRDMSSNLGNVYKASKEAATDLYETAAPANISKALESMPLEQAQQNGFNIYDQLEKKISDLQASPDTFSTPQVKQIMMKMENLQNDLVGAKASFEVHDALNDFAKDLSKGIKFDTAPTATQMAVQEEMKGINTLVRSSLKDPAQWGEEAANHFSQTSDQYNAYKTSLKNFQTNFMKKEVSSTGAKNYVMDPGKVNTFFNNIGDVSQDLRKQYLEDFMQQADSLSKASENYYGYKAAEQTISDKVSQLAKKHEELTQVAQAMKNRIAPEGSNSRLTEFAGAGLAHAAGVSHPVVAGTLGAIEAYKAIKNPYALGSTLNSTINKIQALGNITNSVSKGITSASKSIFSGSARGAVVGGAVSATGYDKRVDRIQELANNPQMMIDHLNKTTNALYDAAPNITNSVNGTMTTAVNFLNSKIPKPQSKYPLSEPFEPSASQKDQFNRYYEAVNDPLSVLSSVKDGSISNEQIEALQAVYPHLLSEMRSNVVQNLNPNKDIPYSTKIALAKFLNTPLDASMTPQSMMSNQIALNGPQQSAQGMQKAPKGKEKTTLGGLKELDVASRSATNTESLESDDA